MEHKRNESDEYSSDAASHPFYEAHVHLSGDHSCSQPNEPHGQQPSRRNSQAVTASASLQGGSPSIPSMSSSKFQEMVIRALFQSTASLIGSSSGLLHSADEAAAGFPPLETGEGGLVSTWNENTYRKAEAKRNQKPDTMRTSAGEESDSQEDFPLPENATIEQRALRTRRLNRCRAKKARELTSNRKALKKVPYVIHVDCSSKPKGIHRHQWKAAVRGQCGRLDPSMDNINHHPKHVVDSIWHALEREWEFEGFAHKAREMFEKSATKFMRNRKMQLKYKCQKAENLPENKKKPNDVSDTHWKKIVELTKKSKKQHAASTSIKTAVISKKATAEDDNEVDTLSQEFESHRNAEEQVLKSGKRNKAVESKKTNDNEESVETVQKRGTGCERLKKNNLLVEKSVASEEDDVNSQIRSLRSQLQWLESLRKTQGLGSDEVTDVVPKVTYEKDTISEVRKGTSIVSQAMKENVAPVDIATAMNSSKYSRAHGKASNQVQNGEPENGVEKQTSRKDECNGEGIKSSLKLHGDNRPEHFHGQHMECGDVVSLAAIIEGEQEDIGKGVLMGFAGSKFA